MLSDEVDVIIVNYNAGEKIVECIRSVVKWSGSEVGKIIVVDNGSVDNSCKLISELFPTVDLVLTGVNNGFGKGCNIGVTKSSAKFVLFLNPDAYFLNDCVSILKNSYFSLECSKSSGKDFFLGGKSFDQQGAEIIAYGEFPGILSLLMDSLGFSKVFSFLKTRPIGVDFFRVGFVSGSLIFAKRKAFNYLNGFDEDYFLYFEETDLQKRGLASGIHAFHVPTAAYFHEAGGTFTDGSFRLRCYLHSLCIYMRKHYGSIGWKYSKLIVFIYKLMVYPKKTIKFFLTPDK